MNQPWVSEVDERWAAEDEHGLYEYPKWPPHIPMIVLKPATEISNQKVKCLGQSRLINWQQVAQVFDGSPALAKQLQDIGVNTVWRRCPG